MQPAPLYPTYTRSHAHAHAHVHTQSIVGTDRTERRRQERILQKRQLLDHGVHSWSARLPCIDSSPTACSVPVYKIGSPVARLRSRICQSICFSEIELLGWSADLGLFWIVEQSKKMSG
eukprot:1852073-Pleurochrysis_carterae.AAC.2